MKSRRSIVFGLLGLCALTCAPLPAAAQNKQCLPLKRVIRSVSQQYGGRVLDVVVDCASGQVMSVRGG